MNKKAFLITLLFFLMSQLYAQKDSISIDEKYLEDQLYFGITYNVLTNKPTGFVQNGLSGGLSLGFIKDIPLNKKRNVAVGIGLGYAYNAYIQNLKIENSTNSTIFEIVSTESFNSNRFLTHLVELPIEFRWRTSTVDKYKFWRIYGGVKVGYVFANSSEFSNNSGVINVNEITALQKLRYGLTLSVGYNTINLNAYYGLNPLFKNAEVGGESIDLKQFNVGFMFYIL